MRKFEQIGVSYQLDSMTKHEALRSFRHSCHVCCYKGVNIDCDKCCIAQTHKEVIAIFDDINKR